MLYYNQAKREQQNKEKQIRRRTNEPKTLCDAMDWVDVQLRGFEPYEF